MFTELSVLQPARYQMSTTNTGGQSVLTTNTGYPQVSYTTGPNPSASVFQSYPIHNRMILRNTGIVSPTDVVVSQPLYVNQQSGMIANPNVINQPVTMIAQPGYLTQQPQQSHEGNSTVLAHQIQSSHFQPTAIALQHPSAVVYSNGTNQGSTGNDKFEMNEVTNPSFEIDESKKKETPPPYNIHS